MRIIYSDNGIAMKTVDDMYVLLEGEYESDGYATSEQLQRWFPNYLVYLEIINTKDQIRQLESPSVRTPRRIAEAILGEEEQIPQQDGSSIGWFRNNLNEIANLRIHLSNLTETV